MKAKPKPMPLMRCPKCLHKIDGLGGDSKSTHTNAPGCLLRGSAREVVSGKVYSLPADAGKQW